VREVLGAAAPRAEAVLAAVEAWLVAQAAAAAAAAAAADAAAAEAAAAEADAAAAAAAAEAPVGDVVPVEPGPAEGEAR
jgi:chemosensory pili system protein ChpA (sensor histidine kinase/response regulator)